jgi:hypothetical protein
MDGARDAWHETASRVALLPSDVQKMDAESTPHVDAGAPLLSSDCAQPALLPAASAACTSACVAEELPAPSTAPLARASAVVEFTIAAASGSVSWAAAGPSLAAAKRLSTCLMAASLPQGPSISCGTGAARRARCYAQELARRYCRCCSSCGLCRIVGYVYAWRVSLALEQSPCWLSSVSSPTDNVLDTARSFSSRTK